MSTAEDFANLSIIAAELASARRLLDEYATYEGSLTGHIAVVIAAVREEERKRIFAGITPGGAA